MRRYGECLVHEMSLGIPNVGVSNNWGYFVGRPYNEVYGVWWYIRGPSIFGNACVDTRTATLFHLHPGNMCYKAVILVHTHVVVHMNSGTPYMPNIL